MSTSLTMRLRVLSARAQQNLGWAGLVGAGLLLASLVWLGLAWQANQAPPVELNVPIPITSETAKPAAAISSDLPRREDLPLLLTQIQQTVTSQGLVWAAADYKLLPATETAPAAMEVRCTLKGSYPKLRASIARLLSSVPGLALRELSMGRANSDTAEVDAKLTLSLFLRDEPPASPDQGGKP